MKPVVLLVAFGRKGYAYAAYNFAKSIKKHYNVHIHLAHDECVEHLSDRSPFDSFTKISDELKYHKGKYSPGKVKLYLDELAPSEYVKVLYVDVDTICLKSIEPLLKELDGEQFATKVYGIGGKNDKIEYSPWTSNAIIWDRMKLNEHSKLCGVNTSFIYFERSEKINLFFTELKKNFDKYTVNDLLITWSGTMPDELIYASTLARMNIIPYSNDSTYFGNKLTITSLDELIDKHYFLSIYGPAGARALTRTRYMEFYDGLVRDVQGFKSHYIMRDKHLSHFVK